MEKMTKKLEKVNTRIAEIKKDPALRSTYKIEDSSVQAELRLSVTGEIRFPIDEIHSPKNLARDGNPLWLEMLELEETIKNVARIVSNRQDFALTANAKTKTGSAKRAAAELEFRVSNGEAFLAAYKSASQPSRREILRVRIAILQAQQKALLPQLRAANSAFLSSRKTASAEESSRNSEALTSGRFWEASKEALKGYFHPPFSRNYLADVSEKWRAALYTEMDSTAWKAGKGDWRHKNVGTGRGYLCGIDDNGDEWGHLVDLSSHLDRDEYGDLGYVASVEDAMAVLFGIPRHKLVACERQGDLLFCPGAIPAGTELQAQSEPWFVRESHTISSPVTFERNGHWFRSAVEITVSHTSHNPVILPAGSYQLYTLQVADAD
jgi:hypothetical protein